MRVRCHRNQIINATGAAIRIVTTDEARRIAFLEVSNNVAVDTQPTRICRQMLNFTNFHGHAANPKVQKWIMRGNAPAIHTDLRGAVGTGVVDPQRRRTHRWAGFGSPDGLIASDVGSTYLRLDCGAGSTLYVKESGSGSTSWTNMSA